MNFLLNTLTGWQEPPRARHQVAQALATHHRVAFVERNRIGRPGLTIREDPSGVALLTPVWPIDYRLRYRLPVLNVAYQEFLFRSLRQTALWAEADDWWILNFDHTATRLFAHFDARRIVYYCNDELIGNGRFTGGLIRRYHRATEAVVASRARLCFATSPFLQRKLAGYGANVHYLPLGAPAAVPPEMVRYINQDKSRRPITVAYVAFRIDRLDPVWMSRLLGDQRFHFLIIGPVSERFRSRFSAPNVVFTGPRAGSALFSLLAEANVCIAPYNPRTVNPGGTPNKVWVYFSLGRPVVLTRIPNLEMLQYGEDVLHVTSDNEAFAGLIMKAFLEDSPPRFRRRVAIAAENGWDRRMEHLVALLAEASC